jgi:phosphatidylglycerol:prolipoprotein diacylglycerol transferase
VHDLDGVLIQFTDTLAIRWYGLAYVSAFLIAFGLLHWYRRRGRLALDGAGIETFLFAMILGVVVGGRLGYFMLYQTAEFFRNPLIFFQFWEGGMASHGGFIGVLVAGLYCARKLGMPALALGDVVVTLVPPGLLLGRLANFINGELWGKVSEHSWAVIFPTSAAPGTPVEWIAPRHPSQLYQAGLEGAVLVLYVQLRFWIGWRQRPVGQLMGEFLVAYSVARWIGEYFREPDAALILGMSRGSFYSLFLFAAGVGLIVFLRLRALTNRKSA